MMKGFDEEFTDLPDYIYTITARIWEGRQFDDITKYYKEGGPVRSPTSLVLGGEPVIAATKATLAEFPDRRLLGEDVIWSVEDDKYLSSHRILSTATHTGDGVYGKASGKKLKYRIIADCWCINNQVVEEWLIRDQGAIAKCIGLTPQELAQEQINQGQTTYFKPEDDVTSEYKPKLSEDPDAVAYQNFVIEAWNNNLNNVENMYHHAAILEAPSWKQIAGRAGIKDFYANYLASFKEINVTINDTNVTENEFGKTVAIRYEINAKNTGEGILKGSTPEQDVYIMALAHAKFAKGKIYQEFLIIDEVVLWKQVLQS